MTKLNKIFSTIIFSLTLISLTPPTLQAQTTYPYEKTFIITAYYSPIEGQKHYLRGSLAADRKLNGNGTNGADGTEVYPGMIAAPKTYAFGTKMNIPGIGTVSVHDRGGAIKNADPSDPNSFDRLDIWMGKGDLGLARAMQWGKRKVKVTVYGPDSSIKENIDLNFLDQQINQINNSTTKFFTEDLSLNEQHQDIINLKTALQIANLYTGEINNIFDTATQTAVIQLQLQNGLIDSETDYAAGYVGPKTRSILEQILINKSYTAPKNTPTPTIQIAKATNQPQSTHFLSTNLKLGDSGEAVRQLQIELNKFNLFALEPTGYYGEITAHAVFKFQQNHQLAGDKSSPGAGIFGPITRQTMSNLINQRQTNLQLIAYKTTQKNYTALATK